MYCSECGKKIPDDSVYCPECGHKVINTSNGEDRKPEKVTQKIQKKPALFVVLLIAFVLIVVSQLGKKEEKEEMQNSDQIVSKQQEKPSGTVWSTDYLFWYTEDMNKDVRNYVKDAKKIIENAEGAKPDTYLKMDDGLFGSGAYEITSEQTEYAYSGKLKNNQPSGFGVLYKYYSMGIDMEAYVPIYMGDFKKGKYQGEGISFYDYSEDSNIASSITYTLHSDESNLEEVIDQYFQAIEYIGEFEDGEENGDGVSFEYPNIHLYSYVNEQIDSFDMENIAVFLGVFEDGKMEGPGKVYYHKYLMYEGDFKDGLMNGTGTVYYPESKQKKYVGEFKDNQYNGTGTLYDENGDVEYKGNWENGDYSR